MLCAYSLLCHQDTQEVLGPPSEWETRYCISSVVISKYFLKHNSGLDYMNEIFNTELVTSFNKLFFFPEELF